MKKLIILLLFISAAHAQTISNGNTLPGLPISLGQKTMANSTSVAIASDQTAIPISGSITATNPSIGADGAASPGFSTQVGYVDGSGNLQHFLGSTNGIRVDGSNVTQPISGTVTANAGTGTFTVGQATGTNLHTVVDSGTVTANAGSGTFNVAGTVTADAGSGTFTVGQSTGTNLHTVVDSGSITATQSTGTNLHTVVDSGTITANAGSGTFTVGGTVTANAGTGTFTVGQATGTNLHTVVDSGTITANAGTGNFTVVQSTGTNLHAVIDSGTISQPIAATGSVNASTISTVAATVTAPANAVGYVVQAYAANTDFITFASGTTATATTGMQLQPGQDSGYIPLGANISIIANSGTQNYNIQWVAR